MYYIDHLGTQLSVKISNSQTILKLDYDNGKKRITINIGAAGQNRIKLECGKDDETLIIVEQLFFILVEQLELGFSEEINLDQS